MGNNNNNTSSSDNLKHEALSGKALMPNTSGKACIVENGKIEYKFRHYQIEYESLIKNLEKLKNEMNIIFTDDAIPILSKKIEDIQSMVLDENIKTSINSFIGTYKSNLKKYYDTITETKKGYKDTYNNASTFLVNFLKNQKTVEKSEQEDSLKPLADKIAEIKNNWGGFNEVIDLVNKICYFEIKHVEKEDRFKEINQYFDENKEEIGKHYKFESAPQFRNMINLKEQILENVKEKTEFFDGLVALHEEYLVLYRKVISSVYSTNLEKGEIANELNEFTTVVIYHRLIRSTEEKLKQINLD